MSASKRSAGVKGIDPILGCLFCRSPESPDRTFRSEEHVVPKSLGNDYKSGLIARDIVLPRGVVCDSCNNGRLGTLDQLAGEWPLLSVFRSFAGTRSHHNKLRDAVGGTSWSLELDPADDLAFTLTTSVQFVGPNAIETVVRFMSKIALEVLAFDADENRDNLTEALAACWDPLRACALGGALPPGWQLAAAVPPIGAITLAPSVWAQWFTPDRALEHPAIAAGARILGVDLQFRWGDAIEPVFPIGWTSYRWQSDPLLLDLLQGPGSDVLRFRGRAQRRAKLDVEEELSEPTVDDIVLPTPDASQHLTITHPPLERARSGARPRPGQRGRTRRSVHMEHLTIGQRHPATLEFGPDFDRDPLGALSRRWMQRFFDYAYLTAPSSR